MLLRRAQENIPAFKELVNKIADFARFEHTRGLLTGFARSREGQGRDRKTAEQVKRQLCTMP